MKVDDGIWLRRQYLSPAVGLPMTPAARKWCQVGGSGSRCAFKSVFERPSRQDRLIEVATDLHRHDRPRRPLAWGTRGAADEAVYGEGSPNRCSDGLVTDVVSA